MASFAKIGMECLQDPLIWLFLAIASVALVIQPVPRRRPLPPAPGPKPLPVIGNMMMADQLTHRGLAALAKQYGGLLHLRMGWLRIFVVSTPEYAREVLHAQDNDDFWDRPASMAILYLTYGCSDMAFAHDARYWRQMRKLCVTKLFSRRRAETWLAVHDGYGELVRDIGRSSGEAVNLGEVIFKHTVRVICRAAFSVRDVQGLEELIPMLREFSRLLEAFHIGDLFPWLSWMGRRGFDSRLGAVRGVLGKFADKIIDDHMRRGKNPTEADADMVDDLLAFLGDAGQASAKDLRLTRDNVKALIMDMLFGGPDNVGFTIEWAMAEMIHCPNILLQLHRELANIVGFERMVYESDLAKLPFLKCVVKETLRMHPPIPVILRGTTKDCVLGGYSVPRGSRVFINTWAINRDGEAWKDPDTFRPSRFMLNGDAIGLDLKGGCYEFLSFGSGTRSCPGQGLGQHAVEFAIAQLVHGFNWKLPDDMNPMELDMSDTIGSTVSRATRLCAVPTPRLRCPL
ncbi:cytochrome P450 84A1-like [Triticum dicoccoides]|uniref:cytochrome P450 84A1-like n=1 Tax=Triticum dicoccoides TaxID=85692 RepID=UPI00188F9392|nr:cytochrome P450 84A1-like [Triticum dicoccoides]